MLNDECQHATTLLVDFQRTHSSVLLCGAVLAAAAVMEKKYLFRVWKGLKKSDLSAAAVDI